MRKLSKKELQMKSKIAVVVTALVAASMYGCGQEPLPGVPGPAGPQGPAAEVAPTTTAPVALTEVEKLVAEENAYRDVLGQSLLTQGLSCTLYTVTGGTRIQSGAGTLTGVTQVATFLHKGVFNQPDAPSSDGLNVLPAALKSTYLNLFLLRCTGKIVVVDSGYYNFELASDDASLLYINGAKAIDNDNSHGITTLSKSLSLRRGVYAFQLDFAQTGAGNQALILKANGEIIPASALYH